jgi:dsDNA-specific endonuclease/ATPase MutS2
VKPDLPAEEQGIKMKNMAKLTLDLHDIYNRGQAIDAELNRVIQQAVAKRLELVEIIPGKGSGQLKKKVLRFLARPEIKKLYHRLEKDDKNFGRVFVHFRF